MKDIVLVAVLAAILIPAALYIYKAKKSGAKCIGCAVGEGGCGCSCCGSEAAGGASSCCCHSDEK